jgi:D-alanyl-D-alanine carboxypeptidase/D-alanyl-D-alanine-endopeptidase (penicillin-binding protein 4)
MRGMKRFALAVFAFTFACSAAAAAAEKPASLQRRVDAALDRPALAHGFWGVEVRNVRTGAVLYARNAEKNFKPASTLKVVTTAAALDAFGPEARFRTTVETAGRLDEGRIVGDVYLVGGGDPNLSGRFHEGRAIAPFEQVADQLVAAGVRSIEGRVLGYDGLFAGDRRGEDWTWGDLVWCYGAEVSALALNDNCVDLTVAAGERPGDPVVVGASPPSSHYQVVSTVTTIARGVPGELRLERDLGGNVIRLSGTHAIGQSAWQGSVALEDPARFAASVFRDVLIARGIAVSGEAEIIAGDLPAARRVLAFIDSAPLSELIATINKESQNLHTEMLLRLLGARRGGVGSLETGREAIEEFLGRIGVPADSWQMQDASGLSRSDLVTPRGMVALLVAMDKHPHGAVFRASLAVAGVDGTLENRMRSSAAFRRVQAKTGTIRNVNGLAGYATARNGDRLAFYAVINHHTAEGSDATAAIDALAALLAGS